MIDYLTSNLWLFWTIIGVVCLILELSSGTFFILCFAIGAVFSLISSLVGITSFGLQVLIFSVFSALSIFFVRPFALKYLHKGEDKRLSNADAIIGRIGTVSQDIVANGFGRVQIDGDDWKAVSIDGLPIASGEKVEIVKLDSIIVTVKTIEQ
jgi:membrane protein implicated in regulation of membrane protease activity